MRKLNQIRSAPGSEKISVVTSNHFYREMPGVLAGNWITLTFRIVEIPVVAGIGPSPVLVQLVKVDSD